MSEDHQYKKLIDEDDDDVEVQLKVTAVEANRTIMTPKQGCKGKVIGGVIGLIFLGPIGAILGIVIGHFFDKDGNSGSGMACCCCKCVWITLAVLLLVGFAMTGFMYMAMKDAVEHLTVTTPHAKFPVVTMTDAQLSVVQDRVSLFVDQLRAKEYDGIKDLVLTEDEINGFIGHSDYLRGNMHVTVKEGAIEEEYSLDMDMLPGGHGRYFVGSDYVKVNKDDGKIEMKMETEAKHSDWFDGPLLFAQLQYLVEQQDHTNIMELYLEKGSFFGQDAPQDFIDQREDLLKGLYNDQDCEDAKNVLEGIENVSIEAGKIVIQPRHHE